MNDAAQLVRNLKPLAVQRRSEEIDAAFQKGALASQRVWRKRARELKCCPARAPTNEGSLNLWKDKFGISVSTPAASTIARERSRSGCRCSLVSCWKCRTRFTFRAIQRGRTRRCGKPREPASPSRSWLLD